MTDLELQLQKDLNPEQFQAAMHMAGPAVIMAGAGSGKTHTLMSRVAHLVDRGIKPERILMLTFTNAAADEMKQRASKLLDDRCKNIVACTYHKFCNMMLRRFGKELGVENYMILSSSDNRNMIDYVKTTNPMFDNLKGFPSAKVLECMFSSQVNKQLPMSIILRSEKSYSKYDDYDREIEYLQSLVSAYGYHNQKYNYDDLLLYMKKLLENQEICRRIACMYDYIMIDEFQDTNNLQEEIITKLSVYNGNITVVGDISQSIYAFRGANVRNLQAFSSKFSNCKTIVLNTNYRSTQEILDLANTVMHNNVKSWTYYDMVANNKNGNKPIFHQPYDEFEQRDYVLKKIEEYHNSGIAYSDMAIIERSSMSSFSIESSLQKAGVPFEKRGGMKFMDYECIGDMLAYFGIITNPYDLLSWFRVLKLHPDIGKKTAREIADNCRDVDFLVYNNYQKRKFYPELVLLDKAYKDFRAESNLQKVFCLIRDFYFETRQRALDLSRMKDDARMEAQSDLERDKTVVEQLFNMTKEYKSIVSFVDDITLDSVSESASDEDTLIVTTVHSAKGLEWKIVFMIDCCEGAFPAHIDMTQYGTPEDEEELRCFYVALTRAKDVLHVISPTYKQIGGNIEHVSKSHYLIRSEGCFR